MDELVDILDASGSYTGTSALKSEAHRLGLFHPTVHVWCYNTKGMILLQQRGAQKQTFPLKWDVSVAGHVGAGEDLMVAAVREVQEEIGVEIVLSQLEKIAVFKTEKRHSKDLFDREFTHTFLYELSEHVPLVKQASEVEALQWFTLSVFENMARENDPMLVPNSQNRYDMVITEIRSRLQL